MIQSSGLGRSAGHSRLVWLAWASVLGVCAASGSFGCDDDPNSKLAVGPAPSSGAASSGGAASGGSATGTGGFGGEVTQLEEAKLNIEHNATDGDTGFQGFVDGEGWKRLEVTAPDGTVVLSIEGQNKLGELGLTELFFESVEPENAKVPIDDVLSTLPEGRYTISGEAVGGGRMQGIALLTHDIPRGAELVAPENGSTVPAHDLVMQWRPVTETLDGQPVIIVAYQLTIEKDDAPHPNAITKPELSIYVGPSTTSLTVPNEFLQAATPYVWEVLAIEASGNQTVSSGAFTTE